MSSANFKLKRTAAASRGFLATARFSCLVFLGLGLGLESGLGRPLATGPLAMAAGSCVSPYRYRAMSMNRLKFKRCDTDVNCLLEIAENKKYVLWKDV